HHAQHRGVPRRQAASTTPPGHRRGSERQLDRRRPTPGTPIGRRLLTAGVPRTWAMLGGAKVADSSELGQRIFDAFTKGESFDDVWTEDCVVHLPQDGVLHGDYDGPAGVAALAEKVGTETKGTYSVELQDVAGGDESVFAKYTYTAERNGMKSERVPAA